MQFLDKWFRRRGRRPFRLFQIEPALVCSLNCVMCPWTEIRPVGGVMLEETFERIRPYLPLTKAVDFTGGGEPLKNPRLEAMVQAAKEAGCSAGFSTNGMLLDATRAAEFVRSGLDWISFSVDAASAQLYERIRQGANFQKVIENIAYLNELKAQLGSHTPKIMMVYVLMVGEQGNVQELPAFIRLAHQLGAEQVIAKNLDVIMREGDDARRVFTHVGEADPQVRNAIHEAQKAAQDLGVRLRLYALFPEEQTVCEHDPLKSLFFNWEGLVSPCITLAYAERRFFAGQAVEGGCLRLGDIRSQGLPTIWDGEVYAAFRERFVQRQRWEKQMLVSALLEGSQGEVGAIPEAPEGCRSCYYLYGV